MSITYDLSPSAFVVHSLVHWHRERGESFSVKELASETRMTNQEVQDCFNEISDYLLGSLIRDRKERSGRDGSI